MKTPPQIVYEAHGSPSVDGCEEAAPSRCYICAGAVARGKPVREWMGSNYSDQNRVRCPLASHVCEACVYVHSRTSPVLGRPPGPCAVCKGTLKVQVVPKKGKAKSSKSGEDCQKCNGTGLQSAGGNFRSYSHCCDEVGYLNASKGEKHLLREFLSRDHKGPWFCAVADSGQKHVLPFAPLNGPGRAGAVRFEEALVEVPDEHSLIDEMIALLTAGVTKEEIERGDYYVRTMLHNVEPVRAFEANHGNARGSGWFSLALWLAQRNEDEFKRIEASRKEAKDARRKAAKKNGDANSGDAVGIPKRVPARAKREAPAELLEPTAGPSPSGSAPNDKRQRVGKSGSAKAADTKPKQGRLFDFD